MNIVRRTEKYGRYTLSIQRSTFHYCTENTYELAVLERGDIIVPECLAHLYSNDTVLGWQSEDDLTTIRNILKSLI